MSYSQKPLIELLKAGKWLDETRTPTHIETVISNVFIFDTKVYKVYKNNNDFYNKNFRDIESKENRFFFTEQDFAWNQKMSPEIYSSIIGVKVNNGGLSVVTQNEAEELLIEMNRAKTEDVLFEKLLRNEILESDAFSIGEQLADKLKKIRDSKPKGNYYKLFTTRLKDVRDWIKSVNEHIQEKESDEYCDFLESFTLDNKELFETKFTEEMEDGGDLHSHNLIYSEGVLHLIDTFSPKEEWNIQHKDLSVYRVGVDIWALGENKKLFDAFIEGYEKGSTIKVTRELENQHVIYASVLMVSYLYMLQRTDKEKEKIAKKMHEFMQTFFKGIESKKTV